MAFQFSLAAVLMVRENAKKREEQALKTIQIEIGRLRSQVDQLNAELANTHLARERAMQNPIHGAHLHSYLHRIQSITETRKSLLERLRNLELERLNQLKIYQAAHRDHETVIDMFNEQRDAHDAQQGRTEQKQLDDIFAARCQRG